MIKLVRTALGEKDQNDPEQFIYVEFNAWLYQGYDDARAALLEVIATTLNEEADRRKNGVDKAKELLQRVNWLRAAKLGVGSGLALALGLPPTGLIGEAVTFGKKALSGDLTEGDVEGAEELAANAFTTAGGLINAKPELSPPREIRAIRECFEQTLKEMGVTLVVLIDDLDRCLPPTTISTLEAIRLFLFLDGAYTFGGGKADFHRARRPQRDDLVKLLHSLSGRIARLLERRGLLIADEPHPALEIEMGSSLDQLQAASINYCIAIGPQAGRKALTLYSVPPLEDEPAPGLVAKMAGFSLHAGTVCEAHQRSKLERLCRYITRAPVAMKRLSVDDRGRVVYRYRHPFRDGSTHVVFEPLDFISRLATLVPRPRLNLTRFHGVFAPNFNYRDRVVRRRPQGKVDIDKSKAPMSWMQRLKRVFAIDIEACPLCGGKLRVIACIEEPWLIRKILGHVQGREEGTGPQARGPPSPSQALESA